VLFCSLGTIVIAFFVVNKYNTKDGPFNNFCSVACLKFKFPCRNFSLMVQGGVVMHDPLNSGNSDDLE